MTRSARMQRISALAELSKKAASERLASSRHAHDANRERLTEFRRYREEYGRALSNGAAISAASARELRQFIDQLDRTIAALEAQVDQSAEAFDAARTHWQDQSRRSRALGDVLARTRREDEARVERAGQRELDERAARLRSGGSD